MQLLTVNLNTPMFWGIYADDPKSVFLDCLPGWSLVNPLLYEPIRQKSREPEYELGSQPTFVVGNRFHIMTKGFMLVSSEANRDVDWANSFIEWDEKLISLIGYFRYASKQFSLMPNIQSFGPRVIDELPDPLFPIKGGECSTQAWHIETALTKDDTEVVSCSLLAEPPPAYDTMLLDAMEATTRQDYRTAVLFSAMSVENLARLKLEIAAKKMPNVVELKELRKARMKQLLHELSLRLLGRSLYQDNQDLYDKALDIYRKRNALVHAGALHDKTDYSIAWLASDAIQCAIQVVEWFGELGGYANPLNKKTGAVVCNSGYYPDSPA